MKAGEEYEKFIYEKFKRFFGNFLVTLDDKIMGEESGIKRQIDVSVKGKINEIDLLYIVQCKDHAKPADIKIIGEFSSVMKDVGAAKGFLICTSGFSSTISQYAKRHGIELLTVEDVESEKWHVDIEIPMVFIDKMVGAQVGFRLFPTPALVEKNKDQLTLTFNIEELSLDGGTTKHKLLDLLREKYGSDLQEDISYVLDDPNLMIETVGIWVPIAINATLKITKKFYLRYLKPTEYSQFTDHLSDKVVPLNLVLENFNLSLDDSYVEVYPQDIPVFENFNFELERNVVIQEKST